MTDILDELIISDNPTEIVESEATEQKPERERDDKGRFIKGMKKRGGRKTGSKGKYSKAKMDAMINVSGPRSLKALEEIANKALTGENPNLTLALRAHGTIVDHWVKITLHNDKVTLENVKAKNKKQEDDDDNSYEDNIVEVKFGTVS
jgi:hypothetical protein